MRKNWQIVILGSLFYWILGFVFHKFFKNVNEPFEFLEILAVAAIGPFLLGLAVSMIIESPKSWFYGVISYLIYFIWVYIWSWMVEIQFKFFINHVVSMLKVYVYIGIVSTLFAGFGGILGNYIKKKKRFS